jgi:hypothetical protein
MACAVQIVSYHLRELRKEDLNHLETERKEERERVERESPHPSGGKKSIS